MPKVHLRNFFNFMPCAAADIINFSRRPFVKTKPISTGDIARIRKIPGGFKIAHRQYRGSFSFFHFRDLLRKVACDKRLALAGTEVRKRARSYDLRLILLVILKAQKILDELRKSVRI